MKPINIPDLNIPRLVIIGGGFGGLELVKKLKGQEIQVVLLDRNNFHTFQPLLYQVATAGLEPDSIAYPIRKIFKNYPNFHFRMAEVEHISSEKKVIETNIGEVAYDYLVIATGSRTNYFGMDSIETHAMPLKTVVQALNLRSYILQHFEQAILEPDLALRESHLSFVIVGGGPTGVELAGALGELKRHVLPNDYPELDVRRMQIHLIEAGSRVLAGLEQVSSSKALNYLKDLGVNVWLDTQVKDYDGITVHIHPNKQLKARTLVWSAGVKGNTVQGIDASNLGKGNRILVDEYCQVKGMEGVYAIGDVAGMLSEDFPHGHPMVAPVAIQQGSLVAKNLIRKLKSQTLKPFKYFDKGSMATIGRNKAVVEVGKMKWQGAFAWFVWMFVHLMSLIGFRNQLVVLINWLWNFMNYDRGIRLIIRPFDRKKAQGEKEQEVL